MHKHHAQNAISQSTITGVEFTKTLRLCPINLTYTLSVLN